MLTQSGKNTQSSQNMTWSPKQGTLRPEGKTSFSLSLVIHLWCISENTRPRIQVRLNGHLIPTMMKSPYTKFTMCLSFLHNEMISLALILSTDGITHMWLSKLVFWSFCYFVTFDILYFYIFLTNTYISEEIINLSTVLLSLRTLESLSHSYPGFISLV